MQDDQPEALTRKHSCLAADAKADAEALTEIEARPTFKLVGVGNGGTGKIDGADLAAWWAQRSAAPNSTTSHAEPAEEDSEQDRLEAAEQLQEEADSDSDMDVNIVDDSCDEGQHNHAGGTQGVTHSILSPTFATRSKPEASTDTPACNASLDDSDKDGTSRAEEAEVAVVTNRDILLRAVQKRKRESGAIAQSYDQDLDYLSDSHKVSIAPLQLTIQHIKNILSVNHFA